jgi:curli production assembly/transport component CsgG
MKKTLLSLAVLAVLSGCATHSAIKEKLTGEQFDAPVIESSKFLKKDANKVLPPEGGPVAVAVYGFRDLTGQRKSQPLIASLSSAVTQGAENYLIKALQDVGDARWFTVLERVGLENLIKERQMIRQMREQYQGKDAKALPPMMFAGIIMEGGIVGYDSNTLTGGSGVRIFGIGASTQYQSDTVTVTLRTVSVATGEILTTVTVTKTVLSYMDKLTVLRFVDDGTQFGAGANALEGELGGSINESINRAIDVAVQAAVVNTINEGARKGHWAFKQQRVELSMPQIPVLQLPVLQLPVKIEEKKEEIKVEEKKDVVVQSQTQSETKTAAVPSTATKELTIELTTPIEKLPSEMIFKDASFVYKEANDKSQKTWWFKKGTLVLIVGINGDWIEVRDAEKRKGFVNKNVLVNKQLQ